MKWVTFTKRTEDPKLAYLEGRLTALKIPHRRNGSSYHAPILEVPEERHKEAWALLSEAIEGEKVSLDDLPDDHILFEMSGDRPHDFDGSAAAYADEQE